MKLLLLSNSTNAGEEYLGFSKNIIKQFLPSEVKNIVFIPYAAVTFSYEEYEEKVNSAWKELGFQVRSIHHFADPVSAIENAGAIVVGGGNTWKLTKLLQQNNLLEIVKNKVKLGIPYIGWSAGSNAACPTLRTTNDMPIAEPAGFNTFNLVPFQINPHYLDANPENHAGETREYRIEEFITENPTIYVVGLREGTGLMLENSRLKLIGNKTARIFKYDKEPRELSFNDDLTFLLI